MFEINVTDCMKQIEKGKQNVEYSRCVRTDSHKSHGNNHFCTQVGTIKYQLYLPTPTILTIFTARYLPTSIVFMILDI